jgi:hypothetical protein
MQIRARVESIATSEVADLKAQIVALERRLALLATDPKLNKLAEELVLEKQRSDELYQKLKKECVDDAMDLVLDIAWREVHNPMLESLGEPPLPVGSPKEEESLFSDDLSMNSGPPKAVVASMWMPDSLADSCVQVGKRKQFLFA